MGFALACFVALFLLFSAPLSTEIERFQLAQTQDFIHDPYYQPAVLFNRIYSSGDAELHASFANPGPENATFAIMFQSDSLPADYQAQFTANISKNARFDQNISLSPTSRRAFGEYSLKMSMLKLSPGGRVEKQFYQKSFTVKASPLGFLGFHAPISPNFPFFPPLAIAVFAMAVAALFLARKRTEEIWHGRSTQIVAVFFAILAAFFAYAFLSFAAFAHTPIGSTDAAQHTLLAINIMQGWAGGEVFNYNDFFEKDRKLYLPTMHHLLAYQSALFGFGPMAAANLAMPVVLFFLVPCAMFLLVRKISGSALAALFSALALALGSKIISWMAVMGIWAEAFNLLFLLCGTILLFEFHKSGSKRALAAGIASMIFSAIIHPGGIFPATMAIVAFAGLYAAHKALKNGKLDLKPILLAAALLAVAASAAALKYQSLPSAEKYFLPVFATFSGKIPDQALLLMQDHWNDPAILLAAMLGAAVLGARELRRLEWQYLAGLTFASLAAVEVAYSVGIANDTEGFNRIFHYVGLFSLPFAGIGLAAIARACANAAKTIAVKIGQAKNAESAQKLAYLAAVCAILAYLAIYSPLANYKPYGHYSYIDAFNEFTTVRTDLRIWPRFLANQLAHDSLPELQKRGITLLLTRSDPDQLPTSTPVDAYCVELSLATNGMDCYNLCPPQGCPDSKIYGLVDAARKEKPEEKKALLTSVKTNLPEIAKIQKDGAAYFLYEVP
ncbi:MAG: DUF6541 family protein [Candidatus Micrarchaeia archaeon]|jgi:hypothetical protein